MGSGSATMGSAGGSAAPEPAKPLTADQLAQKFDECWGFWNAAKYDDFRTSCYRADATDEEPGSGMPAASGAAAVVESTKMFKAAFPDMKGETQLLLINGHNAVSVVLATGTNTAPLKTPMGEMPATNKKMGQYLAQTLEFDDTGHVKHELDFFDIGTMMGQLNPSKDHPVRAAIDKLAMPKEVVIAKDDDKEKANLAADTAFLDAFNKHDIKAFGAALADDVKWFEAAEAADHDKKTAVDGTKMFWKSFSDIKITPNAHWAAGDYVATLGSIEGTNDGDMPMMKMKKTGKKVNLPFVEIDKLDGGKVKAVWIFYQSMAFMTQLGLMPPAPAAAGSGAGSGSAK
jgi:predicted ester cyclase